MKTFYAHVTLITYQGVMKMDFNPPIRICFLFSANDMNDAYFEAEKIAKTHTPFGAMLANVEIDSYGIFDMKRPISIDNELCPDWIYPFGAKKQRNRKQRAAA